MRSNLLLSILLVLFLGQGCIAQLNEGDVRRIAAEEIGKIQWEEEFRKAVNIDAEVRNYIDGLDLAAEFKDLTGISIGAVITILIVIVIIPNLVILLLIFLCCYCCKCGVFYRGDRQQDSNYGQSKVPASQNSQQYQPPRGPSPNAYIKPEVPARPINSPNQPLSPSPNTAQSGSSAWPWNYNNRQGSQTPEPQKPVWPWNRNQPPQNGHQNPAYKSQW